MQTVSGLRLYPIYRYIPVLADRPGLEYSHAWPHKAFQTDFKGASRRTSDWMLIKAKQPFRAVLLTTTSPQGE